MKEHLTWMPFPWLTVYMQNLPNVSFLVVAITGCSTHYLCLWRDGQAESANVTGRNTLTFFYYEWSPFSIIELQLVCLEVIYSWYNYCHHTTVHYQSITHCCPCVLIKQQWWHSQRLDMSSCRQNDAVCQFIEHEGVCCSNYVNSVALRQLLLAKLAVVKLHKYHRYTLFLLHVKKYGILWHLSLDLVIDL